MFYKLYSTSYILQVIFYELYFTSYILQVIIRVVSEVRKSEFSQNTEFSVKEVRKCSEGSDFWMTVTIFPKIRKMFIGFPTISKFYSNYTPNQTLFHLVSISVGRVSQLRQLPPAAVQRLQDRPQLCHRLQLLPQLSQRCQPPQEKGVWAIFTPILLRIGRLFRLTHISGYNLQVIYSASSNLQPVKQDNKQVLWVTFNKVNSASYILQFIFYKLYSISYILQAIFNKLYSTSYNIQVIKYKL